MTMLRAWGLLDVFKPLSDCRQESVEKMEWRILGFRIYIGFRLAVPPLPHTRYRYCFAGMSLQRVFVCSVNLSLFSGHHVEGYYAPPIPYGYHAEGYNVRTDCSLCQTIWTRGLPTRDSSSITGLVLDKSFP